MRADTHLRKLPGEPNTALLATPRAYLPLKEDVSKDKLTAKDLQDVRAYDYIIIGGGTAGCVLANRLTEDPTVTVLVIESGHSDLAQFMSKLPIGFANLYRSAADHDLDTASEKECSGRNLQWPRGKMLGGCSAINAEIYNKGSPDDFEEWASLGNTGWSYDELEPYMRKAESFTPRPEQVDLGADDLKAHGTSGPWQTGYAYLSEGSKVFLEAAQEAGHPELKDMNTTKGTNGVVRLQTFIDKNGQRSSTAAAYLTKDVVSRPNLTIATGQNVTRIIFDQSGQEPRAVGVEMASGALSPASYLAQARREVICCAGSVHTPQILKLSGVGPADELSKHNISTVKNLPHVGANLVDHLSCIVNCRIHANLSIQDVAHPIRSLPHVFQWLRNGTGMGTSNGAETAVFYRSTDHPTATASVKANDLTSGPRSSDMEILASTIYWVNHVATKPKEFGGYAGIGVISLRPESRGTIELASADPFAKPVIKANYLSTQHDRDIMVHGLKVLQDILRTKTYQEKAFIKYEIPATPIDDMTDEQLLQFIRDNAETIYHPMGTARMGQSAEVSVVDSRLRVHGVEGLRVVDASIFPTPLACHPVSCCMSAVRAQTLTCGSARLSS